MGQSSPNRPREQRKLGGGSEDLPQEVTHLPALDSEALREKWLALFGVEPSLRLGRSFMIRALAYRLQERAFGGLKPTTERLLDHIAEGRSEVALARIPKRRAGAGTVLIREWRGVSHRVIVLDHDIVYRGRRYKSLSDVARAITGSHWSGPLFFGIKRRTKEAADG
jgi:hypothetical protein